MTMRSALAVTAFLAAWQPSALPAKTCKSGDTADTRCTLEVSDLRPTQFAVGSIAVDCKAAKISGKSKKKLKKYLADPGREIPAVIGPDGAFYITDHHHLATALHRAGSDDWGEKQKVVHVNVIESYAGRDVAPGVFWGEMLARHRTYNHDNKGTPDMSFALLPTDVGGLLNDPYRTLSRWVRESCGYVKLGKDQCDAIRTDHPHAAPYFMEFYWGEFLRENLPLSISDAPVCRSIPYSPTCLGDEAAQLKGLYEPAMKLVASPRAKRFLEEQGLDPWEYGYNPTGEHVPISWTGESKACESTDPD